MRRIETVAAVVVMLAPVAAPASAKMLTCDDWGSMSADARSGYVNGIGEGVLLGATDSAMTFLADLPPREQIEAAEEVAANLVADAAVSAYVSAMTAVCEDRLVEPRLPLFAAFIDAGERLRAGGVGTAASRDPGSSRRRAP